MRSARLACDGRRVSFLVRQQRGQWTWPAAHFEKLYARMQAKGLKTATAHQVHRTARTAFGEAAVTYIVLATHLTAMDPHSTAVNEHE